MRGHGNGQSRLYRVHMSGVTRATVVELLKQAKTAGTSQVFFTAFREIADRLHRDPLNFGETLYCLPALRLIVHQAAIAPLAVVFGIHQDLPLVFIKGFKLMASKG
jgi:hypothetical protein